MGVPLLALNSMSPSKTCLREVAIVRSGVLISRSYDDGDHGDEWGRANWTNGEGGPTALPPPDGLEDRPNIQWVIDPGGCEPEQDCLHVRPEDEDRFLSVPSSLKADYKADYNTLV